MNQAGIGRAAVLALVLLAACAGPKPAPQDLPAPLATQPFVEPEAGATEAEVEAQNGVPEAREATDDGEVWVYARVMPAVPGLKTTTSVVRFHEGRVVRVDRMGGFPAPVPTFPPHVARAAQDLPRVR